jgi:hypothetical protein
MIRRLLVLAALLAGWPSYAYAQWQYVGYAQITVDDTSGGVPFPASVLTDRGHAFPTQAFCFVESQDIRWTVDGTAPTTSVGNVATAGSALPAINGSDLLSNFRAIRDGGSNGALSCSFFTGGAIQSPLSAGSGGSGSGGGGGGSVTQGTTPWIVAGDGTGTMPVTGTFWQATQPVSGTVTANAGTGFATDATHDSAASSTGPQVMGVAAASGALPTAVTAADAVRWAHTLNGVGYVRTPDPCSDEALKVYFPVDIVTATTTEIVNQSANNYFRLCSINLVSAGANNIAIVEDDTDTCGSPTAGLNGGVTAGEGWNLGSNGGLAIGNGSATVMRSSVVNRYVCIITSAAVQLSGTVVYTLSP